MKIIIRTQFLLLALILHGCAVMYSGFNPINNTGYKDYPVGNLYKVTYYGLANTPIGKFAMNRCAEIAASHNKAYFKMFKTLNDAVANKVATQPLIMDFPKNVADVFVQLLDQKQEGAIEAIPYLKEAGFDIEPYTKKGTAK